MGHPEPKTIKEPKVTVTVEVNYQEPVKFTDTVDMGEVPEGQYTPPPDAGNGGSYTEPTIIGSHHTISANFPNTDQQIASPIIITQAGTYEIEAKISYYLSNTTSNQTISVIKNGTVQTGVLVSDTFVSEVVGTHAHILKYYLNGLVATDTISINVATSSAGNVNNSVCQLTAKRLQNAVTITPTSDSGGGGV